jgi:hypothetical protein
MDFVTGPIRLQIATESDGLRTAVHAVASRWPVSTPEIDVPILLDARIRLELCPGRLPPHRPYVREGDPARGPWRLGHDPLWVAEGDGLASVTVRIVELPAPAAPEFGLRQFLRYYVSEALLALGGLALHAAAATRPEGATVFLAPSGGGKTTLVRRHAGAGALSDDMALVVPGRGGPWVVPSPFPGREGVSTTGTAAPLVRIVDLRKGEPPNWMRLSIADAVTLLVLRAKVPDNALPVRERVLDSALRLAQEPGVLRLGLPIDRSPWTILDAP